MNFPISGWKQLNVNNLLIFNNTSFETIVSFLEEVWKYLYHFFIGKRSVLTLNTCLIKLKCFLSEFSETNIIIIFYKTIVAIKPFCAATALSIDQSITQSIDILLHIPYSDIFLNGRSLVLCWRVFNDDVIIILLKTVIKCSIWIW